MLQLFKSLAGASAEASAPPLTIGGVPLARSQEPLHLLLAGSTGTGKTTAVAELLDGITDRGDRAVIVDPNGGYLSHFYEPGDRVLNLFDRRSPGWSPFNEVARPYDFDKIARSIVPDGQGSDAAWHFYAQGLIAEVMRALLRDGRGTTAALVEALTVWPAEQLHRLVIGTAMAGLFDPDAARALASTRFILASHLKPYQDLQPGDFSLRDWVHSGKGRLFITWREDMSASLAPLIACWVDVVCTATLSLPPDAERRLWLLLDELPSIGKVNSLEAALTKGRKHGLCCVAGVQSTAQLERLYGRESSVVLRSCFRNFAAFAVAKADPDTAETFSKALGEREVDRAQQSQSRGAGRKDAGAPLSISMQYQYLAPLKTWFRWLSREHHILANPAADLDLPKQPKRLPRSVPSVQEVEAILAEADPGTPQGLRDRALLELLYATGLRRMELPGLGVYDADLGRGVLRVRHGKGRRERVVPLGERAGAWVEKYLAEARPQLLAGQDGQGRQALFLTDYGEPIKPEQVADKVKRYMGFAGVDRPGSTHLLRHACATHMFEGGADIRFIQEMLGHASIETTEIYTHVSIDKLIAVHRATHPSRLARRSEQRRDDAQPAAGPSLAEAREALQRAIDADADGIDDDTMNE